MHKKFSLPAIAMKFILGFLGIAVLILIQFAEIFPQDWYVVALFSGTIEPDAMGRFILAFVYSVISIFIEQLIVAILGIIARRSERTVTICDMLTNFLKYVLFIFILLLVLGVFGVNTAALAASAGILSLVIGLGCQSLIADILAGVFIVFEGSFQVGDIVVVSGFRGTVQHIGIRSTRIIDAVGNIKIVNNASITDLINNTQELSVAVCTCSIDYAIPMERIEAVINANLKYMHDQIPQIVEGPIYLGVDALADSGVVVKLIAKCKEQDKFGVQRALNREIKVVFDANDITIPFPQVTINQPVPVSTADPITLVSTVVREDAHDVEKKKRKSRAEQKEEKRVADEIAAQRKAEEKKIAEEKVAERKAAAKKLAEEKATAKKEMAHKNLKPVVVSSTEEKPVEKPIEEKKETEE